MSYDIYCYKPTLNLPNLEDAYAVIDRAEEAVENSENNPPDDETYSVMISIADALIRHNPRLKDTDFDFQEMMRPVGIYKPEGMINSSQIELNAPKGEPQFQILISPNMVSLNVPYWHADEQAYETFQQAVHYTKIISQTAGYFVYDPQTGKAFNPQTENGFGQESYENVVNTIKEGTLKSNKPWWNFWRK